MSDSHEVYAAMRKSQPLTQAARDVLAERQRQIDTEGWTQEHDDAHTDGSLARAAAAYCLCAEGPPAPGVPSEFHSSRPWDFNILRAIWPRSWNWPAPKDRRRNLVRAAALILAEIERLDRVSATAGVALHSNAPDLEAERERFEAVYPRPRNCDWISQSGRFCATDYDAWDAHKHIERWEGWRARATAGVLVSKEVNRG
jgi:hypothetical protein